jgi:hypothetical protein
MIKETTIQQNVTTRHRYCDVCGAEIEHRLVCMDATCSYCRKDLCDECIGYEEETEGEYRSVWCETCWLIGRRYRPIIEELDAKLHVLYQEWQDKCKNVRKGEGKIK